jgi:hypothetical protein
MVTGIGKNLVLFNKRTVSRWHTDAQLNNKGTARETSIHLFIHSFIYQWFYSPLLDLGLFFSFVIFFTQMVGLLGRVISPSQGRYLHTGQHKHKENSHTDTHALSGFRTHDPIVQPSEDSSCLRPRGHCDHQEEKLQVLKYTVIYFMESVISVILYQLNTTYI